MSDGRTAITAVIKAKNEEARLAQAIRAAKKLATDVVVVDDASTDSTRLVAEREGAVVLTGVPHGGRIDLLDKQGFEHVSSGWLLRLDADEILTDDLAARLREVADDPEAVGASYARANYFFGAPLKHGGWMRPYQLGFFRADAWDHQWDAALHSQVPIHGRVVRIPAHAGTTLHYDYANVSGFIERSLVGYAQGEAREMLAAGVVFEGRRLWFDPWKRLFGRYLFRGGWRDGRRGLVVAALLSAYDIVRWAALWDLERERSPQGTRRDVDEKPGTGDMPRVDVAGVRVVAARRQEVVIAIVEAAGDRRVDRAVFLTNAYTAALAASDPAYSAVLNSGWMCVPDGRPMAHLAARRVEGGAEQIRGVDLFRQVLDRGQAAGLRHFLLGTDEATLEAIRLWIQSHYPKAHVVGVLSPAYGPLTEAALRSWGDEVEESRANVVWVALGTPKQDFACSALARRVPGVVLGVGAAFDFVAGSRREAPAVLRSLGLEWLYRWAQEPRRLTGRYLRGNATFLRLVMRERLARRRRT